MARIRKRAALLVAAPALLVLTSTAVAAPAPTDPVPIADEAGADIAPVLRTVTGKVEVVVELSKPSLAGSLPENAWRNKKLPPAATQRAIVAGIKAQQNTVAAAAKRLGATELGRVELSHNALMLEVDASKIGALAATSGVKSVRPLGRYEKHESENPANGAASGSLAQAAEYLGVLDLRANGFDGTGVKVAVFDSGIDYTHFNLGGPGTTAFYDQCFFGGASDAAPVGDCADYFGPTAPKVKGGYDFTGDTWSPSGGTRTEDPNPIDAPYTERDGIPWDGGHGTHVADIIGGHSADDSHLGMAPGVDLYALKVCSSVSTSCNGVALLKAVDWALDPNGDDDIGDAIPLWNFSLGSDWGHDREDDLSAAVGRAANQGIVVVASAGNGNDAPFKVGSPSSEGRVISVAQTALPDDTAVPVVINSPAGQAPVKLTAHQPWTPFPASAITGDLARPGSPANNLGCNASDFASGAVNGKIALVDRGTCNISTKAFNAESAGAIAMLLINNVAGMPPVFSSGGEVVTIPVFSMTQAEGNRLAALVAAGTVNVSIDPAQGMSLRNTTVGTSSRGPTYQGTWAKPDIGAPGAWTSAVTSTGNGNDAFGGTSGAAPTVTGVAAIVMDKWDGLDGKKVKALLLNRADTGNTTPDPGGNLYPTPVSRIGAGEVRGASADATFIVEVLDNRFGNISLGNPSVPRTWTKTVQLRLTNYAATPQTFTITPQFRDPADAALGALTVTGRTRLTVPAKTAWLTSLTFTLTGSKLPTWPFVGLAGMVGNDGTVLNGPELDGNLVVTAGSGEQAHLGWHVLPRRSAQTVAPNEVLLGGKASGSLVLRNSSTAAAGDVRSFALLGNSGKLPPPAPGQPGSRGSNVAVIDLRALGIAEDGDWLGFAVATHERRALPALPGEWDIFIDTNRDGTDDFVVFNYFMGDGRSASAVVDLATGGGVVVAFVEADMLASTAVLWVPKALLGVTDGQTIDLDVAAFDAYFSGQLTDAIAGMTYTVGKPRFVGQNLSVPKAGSATMTVTKMANAGPSTQRGLLLLLDNNPANDATLVWVRP